jgi:hypothetical protein
MVGIAILNYSPMPKEECSFRLVLFFASVVRNSETVCMLMRFFGANSGVETAARKSEFALVLLTLIGC